MACGEEAPSAPAEGATAPAEPTSPGEGDEPRGPRGAEPVVCDGSSNDPDAIDPLMQEAAAGATREVIESLESLAGRYPGSATARVRLGELLLRAHPPAPDRAQTWFERALSLDAEGCTLGYRDRWGALEGSAISRFMQGDYAGAIPHLERSLAAWPNVRGTRFNLACALCQTGDLPGCRRELETLLNQTEPAPDFLPEQEASVAYFRQKAQRDPDIAPLREHDPDAFRALIAP